MGLSDGQKYFDCKNNCLHTCYNGAILKFVLINS